MLISTRKKITFIAMSKAGSTAIESALAPLMDFVFSEHNIKHANLQQYQRFMVPMLKQLGHQNIKTICVLRHPIEWLQSWHRYRSRDGLVGTPRSTRNISFDDFVHAYLSEPRPAFADMLGRPINMLKNQQDQIGIDYLFRYDQMDQLTALFEEIFETKLALRRENISPNLQIDMTTASKSKLEAYFAPELELYEQLG